MTSGRYLVVVRHFEISLPSQAPKRITKYCMYSISCSCGKVYKGGACRPLKVRLKENRKAICRGQVEKLDIADHIWKEKRNHLPLWDETIIVEGEEQWKRRCLKEAEHILCYSDLLSRLNIEMNTIRKPFTKNS